ncbi:MAG: MBL fold metallo-hydrolase [Deltaproteobacteria bacterium]|nr:MBL fold metallo-hydrolase [Deltaproteobacteria bacterium]
MTSILQEVDKVEILTLQDNYIDLVSGDNSEVVQRALPVKGMEIRNSLLAEHGFSALLTLTRGDESRSALFDFGFSEHGADFNAEALDLDMGGVEVLALSHGHLDHVGGLERLAARIGKPGIELVLHPTAFRNPRYMKLSEELKLYFPPFTREKAESAGVTVTATREPATLLGKKTARSAGTPSRTTRPSWPI